MILYILTSISGGSEEQPGVGITALDGIGTVGDQPRGTGGAAGHLHQEAGDLSSQMETRACS